MSILDRFGLKGAQQTAAGRVDAHLAVTAGAGSGKTRALVARFLYLVERGAPLRRLIAITFTEKAAREMRARIRREIEALLADSALGPAERAQWEAAFIELDAARIGTIHGLCADLLRLHPAEAGVDPRFTVLEEGRAALLRAQASAAALDWAVTDLETAGLFAVFAEGSLLGLLNKLFDQRLEAGPALQINEPLARWETRLQAWLKQLTATPVWAEALAELAAVAAHKPDDKLEAARREVLRQWAAAQQAAAAGAWDDVLEALRLLRKAISTAGQKGNWDASDLDAARAAMSALRAHYEAGLAPVVGRSRWELDRQAAALLPGVRRLFDRALLEYQVLKDQRLALDFDDLEAGAGLLLNRLGSEAAPRSPLAPGAESERGMAPGTSGEAAAVLVDEFQDTNERQRQIVYALAGFDPTGAPAVPAGGANLFVVGDAKQSIYRFRQADVTVFRRIHADLQAAAGVAVDLDLTFRAHAPLLEAVEALLAPLMGTADDPARPYLVPFAPLQAYRREPRAQVQAPFLELQLGLGANADEGRRAAAAVLANRLRALKEAEGFAWEHMALLFRASTAFPVYEEALEAAGLPFVTVAGRGFYNRPEIRDLLNALAALADPRDDLALAGLLRSPAFGLTDADLYRLRFPDGPGSPRPLWASLSADARFSQAAAAIRTLHTLSGRLPVAELLQRFLDITHYRAVLRVGESPRLARNVDKLLADARRSRLVPVPEFLEYVAALRDVGAREGEAPADPAAGSGAIQLMTVHKAKGLEFPLVVLADAGYEPPTDREPARVDAELGLLLRLRAEDKARPVAWALGAEAEADREAAEDRRLLYVALTRAQEKVIISGGVKLGANQQDPGQLLAGGWLKELAGALGLEAVRLPAALDAPQALTLAPAWAGRAAVSIFPPPAEAPAPASRPVRPDQRQLRPGRLVPPYQAGETAGAIRAPDRVWRVITGSRSVPAWVVGKLAHEALRRWRLEAAPAELEAQMRPAALAAGLSEDRAIRQALREARRLVERFRAHPLYAEIDSAAERYHELPYLAAGDVGVIDALYRTPLGWTIVDFKTDELRDDGDLGRVLPRYQGQLRRYVEAVRGQLGLRTDPRAILVFLNLRAAVQVVPLEGMGG